MVRSAPSCNALRRIGNALRRRPPQRLVFTRAGDFGGKPRRLGPIDFDSRRSAVDRLPPIGELFVHNDANCDTHDLQGQGDVSGRLILN